MDKPKLDQLYSRFEEIIVRCVKDNRNFNITLNTLEINALHHALLIATTDPRVKEEPRLNFLLKSVRQLLINKFIEMGFTKEEAVELDQLNIKEASL